MLRHVSGILCIDKRTYFVESIEIKSTQPFKPQTGVKINSLDVSIKFGQVSANGPIALFLVSARVRGRAYLRSKLKRRKTDQ